MNNTRIKYIHELLQHQAHLDSPYGLAIAEYLERPDGARLEEMITELTDWALECPLQVERILGTTLTEILYAKRLTESQPQIGLN